MTELDEALNDLLSRWHHWAQGERVTRGHAPASAGCGLFRASRQYDDTNGSLDSALEDRRSAQVDHEVREMIDPYRAAIYVDARNLCLGIAVWVSPRLPPDPIERERVMATARQILSKRLISAGVL